MKQHYIENTEYEILTPNGWEDFEGIYLNENANKSSKTLILADGTFITATDRHRFFDNGKEVAVESLKVGDYLDTIKGQQKIIKINSCILVDTYEIFNATNHVIIANNIHSHNCDEFAYVEPNIAVEFWTSISPTLATGGKAIITSTPNSDEDQFAQIWNEANKRFDEHGNTTVVGKNGFYPCMAIWSEHPDRDEKWANEERSRVGQERFEREHECKFLVFDETLISSLVLAGMEGQEPSMKMGQARWYKKINSKSTYMISLDPSLGTGGDYAAIEVVELPAMDQVCEWNHNLTPIQGQVRILRDILKYIEERCKLAGATPNIYYSVENNTLGEAALVAIDALGEDTFPGLFLSEPVKRGHVRRFRKGFNTTHLGKVSACAKLKQLVETKVLHIRSKALISELKSFVAEGVTFKAKSGQHDDLVSSMLLNIRMIMALQEWDPLIYDKMRGQDGMEEYDLPMPIYVSTY